MKTYLWKTKWTGAYRDSTIVVVAEDVKQARLKATKQFRKWYRERYDYHFLGNKIDSHYQEDYNNGRKMFLRDIAVEPTEATEPVFIYGGD